MISKKNIPRYKIASIELSSLSLIRLSTIFEELLTSKNISPVLITTFNLDFLRIALQDNDFKKICQNAFLNLPDGHGITSLIRLKYSVKIERITGNDIFPVLLKIAFQQKLKVAIVGGYEKEKHLLKKKIAQKFYIDEKNILTLFPSLHFENDNKENSRVIEEVTDFEPDILFAALGCPRQEKWLYKNMNKIGSKINIGVGATIDYFLGNKKRSPAFLQKIGFEWLWRLINEPGRLFGRYILNDIPLWIKLVFTRKY